MKKCKEMKEIEKKVDGLRKELEAVDDKNKFYQNLWINPVINI